METFVKISKILWKRYKIWIIMLTVLVLLLQVNLAKKNSELFLFEDIYYSVEDLELLYEDDGTYLYDGNSEFMGSYESEINRFREEFEESYEKGLPENFFNNYVEKYWTILDKNNIDEEDFEDEKWMENNPYDSQYLSYFKYIKDEYLVRDSDQNYKYDITDKVISVNFIMYFFIIVVGLLLMSIEHLTKFYEFTKLFPWKEEKAWISKYIFGLGLALIVYLASIVIRYFIFRNSPSYGILAYNNVGINLLEALLKIAAVHSLVMSAGALAGNFLGHLGILLMTLVGVGLYLYNIIAFTDIFFSDGNNPLYKVYRGLENIPLALQGILAPIRPLTYTGDLSLDLIASLIIMIILYFIIGLIWLKRSESERSQMLVLSRPESKYIGFFAALTTANIIGNIGIRVGAYSIISQGVFVLSLIIFYKFYSILFKSRIGLS